MTDIPLINASNPPREVNTAILSTLSKEFYQVKYYKQ